MFHGIEVNVVDMTLEIAVIANSVFPVTSLPQSKVAVAVTLHGLSRGDRVGAEVPFDSPPPSGKIRVRLRQGEDCMEVIRQNYDRVDRKRPFLPSLAKRGAKRANMIDKSCRMAIRERHREEVCPALNEVASIGDHLGMVLPDPKSRISLRSCGLLGLATRTTPPP